MYIAFEGIVGVGKSTQAKKLADYLKKMSLSKRVVLTREPGGDEIAESIRKLVQGTEFDIRMDPVCEAYLYAASRAQSLRSIVIPNLGRNHIVVSDRSLVTSLVYQGIMRNVGIRRVMSINLEATRNCLPDKVIYLGLDTETALSRTSDKAGDKWEKESVKFFDKARKGYLVVERYWRLQHWMNYKKCWINVDASGSIEEVFNRIVDAL